MKPSGRAAGPARPRLSPEKLSAIGKRLRDKCPRSSHAGWKAPHDRRDPLVCWKQSNKGRIPELIPIRYGRMVQDAVHLLSGGGAQHGRRPGRHAGHRPSRAGVRRLPPPQLRRFRDARTPGHLRRQRHGRDSARALGVGRQASRGERRPGLSEQRLQRAGGSRCRARLRSLLPRAHGGIRPDVGTGRLVLEHRGGEDVAHAQGQGNPPAAPEAAGEGPCSQRRRSTISRSSPRWPGRSPSSRTTLH